MRHRLTAVLLAAVAVAALGACSHDNPKPPATTPPTTVTPTHPPTTPPTDTELPSAD